MDTAADESPLGLTRGELEAIYRLARAINPPPARFNFTLARLANTWRELVAEMEMHDCDTHPR